MGGGYLLIILILLVVTNGITYGASQLTSESVSYQKKDGELTTVKSALDDLITKSSKVDELEKKVTDYEQTVHYLADKVTVGDYVAYDAGRWENSAKLPTKQGEFGGNEANKNKGNSVACHEGTAPTYKGWRVLYVDKKSKTVTIVHAGQPECYYHASSDISDESVKLLNERAQSTYKNNKYAESAHAMTYQEAFDITGDRNATDKTLRKIGTYYWLATETGVTHLWIVQADGSIYQHNTIGHGFRPVIVLKSTVLTTGRGTDQVGNPDAWILA